MLRIKEGEGILAQISVQCNGGLANQKGKKKEKHTHTHTVDYELVQMSRALKCRSVRGVHTSGANSFNSIETIKKLTSIGAW